MEFFASSIETLKTVVILIGAGLAVWGVINLLEGYGNDNPGAKSQGMKQLMAGAGIAIVGMTLVPQLANMFSAGFVMLPQMNIFEIIKPTAAKIIEYIPSVCETMSMLVA